MNYGLHGKLQATEARGKELANILLKASEKVLSMDSCHLYLVSMDKTNPDTIWITEVWDSKEAHDDSLKDPDIRSLIGEAMPLMAEMPKGGTELKVLGGLK